MDNMHLHAPAISTPEPHSPAQPTDAISYSPAQAAAVSSLSLRSIAAAIATDDLPSFKRGRRRIIFRADLEAYLAAGRAAAVGDGEPCHKGIEVGQC
jgi:hypothetical protein